MKMPRSVVLALILLALFTTKTQCQEMTPAPVPAPVRSYLVLWQRGHLHAGWRAGLGAGPTL